MSSINDLINQYKTQLVRLHSIDNNWIRSEFIEGIECHYIKDDKFIHGLGELFIVSLDPWYAFVIIDQNYIDINNLCEADSNFLMYHLVCHAKDNLYRGYIKSTSDAGKYNSHETEYIELDYFADKFAIKHLGKTVVLECLERLNDILCDFQEIGVTDAEKEIIKKPNNKETMRFYDFYNTIEELSFVNIIKRIENIRK
jgi:hypothetical protein